MPALRDALESARELPIGITLPGPLFLGMVAWYNLVAPFFNGERKRAYVLSTLSSFTMTLCSFPFVYAYLNGGIPATSRWRRLGHTFSLTIGYIAYRNEIGMLTGWVHHIVYIGIMVHCATSKQSCIFLLAAIMELPTFDLAISNLFPGLRSDERFLTLMMMTRIMFNAWLLADCARSSSRAVTEGSWVPIVVLALAFTLHTSWMHGGVSGYLRRRTKAAKTAKEAEAATIAAAEKTPLLLPMTPALDPTTPSLNPVTPDESPLVTPRTPGLPATLIRDNFFPNISIPTMPNLPIPAIPTLSDMAAALPQAKANLNQLQFGFADAVNRRWEEQREKLAAHRGALAARGEALLRRRRWDAGEDDE
ncbi:uncharacterized protein CcaverHIS019_0207150 [Cutaneotrichosporon cavernicola]|uniref:TLC domain-containing protein n=1 Tax=Cutaneotrichosporon cavernicola TaxID=279322 RepID=A0AA48IFP2_9TREE|nr:uncharacterized protein CcaverHIS019_0207150 [Cutaneotrichosporon cavernicola]BEI89353.1 hypothetical protein CcaverHIS019_0207150 [Cutaneotrichosporon cavernicola]